MLKIEILINVENGRKFFIFSYPVSGGFGSVGWKNYVVVLAHAFESFLQAVKAHTEPANVLCDGKGKQSKRKNIFRTFSSFALRPEINFPSSVCLLQTELLWRSILFLLLHFHSWMSFYSKRWLRVCFRALKIADHCLDTFFINFESFLHESSTARNFLAFQLTEWKANSLAFSEELSLSVVKMARHPHFSHTVPRLSNQQKTADCSWIDLEILIFPLSSFTYWSNTVDTKDI